jgi:UDP-N-acetylmuramoyl-tripeptide--D-alanyl-D-alanine ligase
MAEHAALVRPDLALVTAVGAEHLDQMGDIETVAAEEASLLACTLRSGGEIAVNADDPWLAGGAGPAEYVLNYRLAAGGGPSAPALVGRLQDDCVVLDGLGLDNERLLLPLPGRHNALNLLAAAVLSRRLGLDARQMRAGLAGFKPDAARSNLVRLPGDITILADYYNASPLSVAAALETLGELDAERRWVCLGDMLELGVDEAAFHRELAAPIVTLGAAGVLLHGPRMKTLANALREARFSGEVGHFDDKTALGCALKARLEPGDAVLIKGSRGTAMEDVLDGLRDNPAPAPSLD